MKGLLKKTIAILVLIMIMINSSLLLVISTAIDAIDKVTDETKINLLHEIDLEKYINYSIKDDNATLVQFNLKTGIEYVDGEEYRPINSTSITLKVPKLEEYPENVEVIGKSTKSTNGSDNAKDFEYTYDKETGELKIEALNKKDKKGNRYSEKIDGARDEYIIICYYNSNCYKNDNEERNFELRGLFQTIIADRDKIEKSKEIYQSYTVTSNVSGLVSTNIKTSDIYNGYINSNKKNGTEYKTEYLESLEVNISKKEISDNITLDIKDSFINEKDNTIETSDIIYKSTKINKKDILDILGKEGYLKIFNENKELLGELNIDTEVGDDNIYEIKYDGVNKLFVETSKPLKVGTILLQNVKELRETVIDEEINRIQSEISIACTNNVRVNNEINEEETKNISEESNIENSKIENDNIKQLDEETIKEVEVYNFVENHMIDIKKAQSNVELLMNRTEWTNNIQNEVEFTLRLLSDSNKYKLFENPVIEIKLPKEIEKIILNDYSLLYANGLNIDKVEIVEENDIKTIRVILSGMQKEYYDNLMIEGTELLISASIIAKKDIYSTESVIQLNSTNNNDNESISKEYKVNIVSINNKLDTEEENEINESLEENTSNEENISNEQKEPLEISSEVKAILGENILENEQTVFEHEFVRYNVKVKNNSKYKVDNIKVVGKVPEGTTFVNSYFGEYSFTEEDKYITIEDEDIKEYIENVSLAAGEEIELFYWIRANLLEEGVKQKDIESNISIFVDEEKVSEYTINNIIKKAKMEFKINGSETDGEGNRWIYHFDIKNNTDEDIKNIVANIKMSDEMEYVKERHELDGVYGYSATKTTTGLRIDIPELKANESKVCWIEIQATGLDENKADFEVQTYGTVKGDGTDTYHSNLNREIIHTFGIDLVQESEKEGQILQAGEEVEFNVKIKDISSDDIHFTTMPITILNYSDINLEPVSMKYEYYVLNGENRLPEKVTKVYDIPNKYVPDGINEISVPDLDIVLGMLKNKEINLTVKFRAKEVTQKTETSTSIKVQYDYGGTHVLTSNIIKNVIAPIEQEETSQVETPIQSEQETQPDIPVQTENPEQSVETEQDEKRYSISGFAWEDKNKDGKYNNNETKLKNITVKLFDSETNSIVKDINGNNLEVVTNDDGEYKFEDVNNGKYLVLFEYDANNYDLTSYKKDLVTEDKNSDVVTKQVAIDGVEKTVGLTDILTVEDQNVSYINTGIVKNEEFDLSLDKSVTRMRVTYDDFNKEYTYDETKIAKIEMPSKKIDGAKVDVEFLIKITNEGSVDGYVDEIIEYLPEGFTFDSTKNDGWTQTNSEILKNTSYAGVIIKPGETKTVKLYLTRVLNSETIGILKCSTEILKSSSINGDKDIDSINGNRVETEDDYSTVQIIISPNTGIMYFGIIILAVICILILAIVISRNDISLKKIGSTGIGLVVIFAIILSKQNLSYAEYQLDNFIENGIDYNYVIGEDDNIDFNDDDFSTEVNGDTFKEAMMRAIIEHVNELAKNYGVIECSYTSVERRDDDVPSWFDGNSKYCWKVGVTDGNGQLKYDNVEVEAAKMSTKHYNIIKDENGNVKDEIYLGLSNSCNYKDCNFEKDVQVEGPKYEKRYYYYYRHSNNYVHHGNNHNYGELYCTDGGAMAVEGQGDGSWTYHFDSVKVTSATLKEIDSNILDYVIITDKSKATYLPYNVGNLEDTDYFVVGPFNFETNGEITGYEVTGTNDYILCDKDGNPVNYTKPLNKTDFYLRVRKSVKKVGVKVNAEKEGRQIIKVQGTWTEIWKNDVGKGQILGKDEEIGIRDREEYVTSEIPRMTYAEAQATAEIPVGTLKIEKRDYDTDKILNGYKVTVQDPYFRYKKTFEIGEKGFIEINNLPVEKSWYEQIGQNTNNEPIYGLYKEDLIYTITEIEAPPEYNIDIQDKVGLSKIEINLKKNEIITIGNKFKNRQYGNLVMKKVDDDTGNSNLEDNIFKNVKFKIYYTTPKDPTPRYIKNFTEGDIKLDLETTTNVDEAQIFETDENSQFKLTNLPKYYIYHIVEVDLPIELAEYYDISSDTLEVVLENNYDGTNKPVYTETEFKNKQKYVSLEGYVWEDIASGKMTIRDDLYTEIDKRIPDITVYLKKDGSIIAERKTNSNGEYLFEGRGYKNKSGLAKMDDYDYTIDIDTLSQYSIEFEYNGLKYEKVITNLNVDNGSKATEMDLNRTNFNDKFYNIQKDKTGSGVNLTYTRPKGGVSELVQNTQYTVDSLKNSVNPNKEALMLADTATAGYKFKWSVGVARIRNINLGIFERAQPDLSIATDLNDIQLTINGSYSHTYDYKSRSPYMNNTGIPDKDINPGYDAVLDGFSVGVKRGNGTYKDCSYTREIYDSYIAYTKANKDSNDRLRVFVKYKIAIKNESGSLISRASLKNYADSRLNYSYSYYLDGNGNQVPVNWNSAGNAVWQSEEIKVDIKPAECIYVYLAYELNTDTIIAMANLQNGETLKMNDNITEISTYSTWDKKGNKYGGIDKDSAPDNAQIGNFDTYEDDTDVAPGLSFARKSSKTISGLVYEDTTNLGPELKTGEERRGNGRFDNGEKTVKNVDVQIVDCNENRTTKLYNLDGAGNVIITDAKVMTGKDGQFRFTGLVPGKYHMQYIYGRYNGSTQTSVEDTLEVTTESYKSTILNSDKFRTLIDNGYIDYNSSDSNALWYWYQKPENFDYSSAVDDYNRRSRINQNLSTINYNVKTNYENKTDDPENHYMVANTGVMDFPIEDTRVQTTDINYIQGSREYKLKFGIVERPRQSLELNKEISHIRITLANGQVLVDGDPRNNNTMKYVQYPMYGKLKIEVDNEVIQGSTIDLEYEITVDNKSELDYDHIRYYQYGDKDNEVLNKLVRINIDAIVDYVDEKLSVTYNIEDANNQIEYYNPETDTVNNKWKLITDLAAENNKLAGIDIQDSVYNSLIKMKRTNIVVIKTNQKVEPNGTGKIYLQTKRLLTSLTDDELFDNYIEMIQSSNPVGRFYGVNTSNTTWGYHTPGNFNIENENTIYDTSESDNNDYINRGYQAQATIIPPTGINKVIIYCSIGLVILVIIAGGIILIKKKFVK